MAEIREPNPRVLIVDLSEHFGGASMRALNLLQGMPAGTATLAVLDGSPVAIAARSLGLEFIEVGTKKFDPRIVIRLVQIIRAGKYKVIDTQNVQSKFWGSMAARVSGISLVSTLNSWYRDEHGGHSVKGRLYSWVERWTSYKQTRYIVVSKSIYNHLVQSGNGKGQIDLIYNAVTIDPESIPASRDNLLAQYRLPADAFICVSAGRLVWAKGYDELIRAFALLARKVPHLYCIIAGGGELQDRLTAQIQDAGLANRIILAGNLSHDQVLSMIKVCDIFVMPSKIEGTPIALLEAAALERPILTTRSGGIPELVEANEEALLVAPSATELAEGLLRLVDDSELRSRLARQAKKRVERDFRLEEQVKATLNAYRKAARRI